MFAEHAYTQNVCGTIKVDIEFKSNNRLNYLNVTIIREPENPFGYRWFRKPMVSDRFMKANSFLPKQVVDSTVMEYINTALDLSDEKHRDEVIQEVTYNLHSL